MPRVLIDISEVWLTRFNEVMPSAIDTLTGFDHQINDCVMNGSIDATGLLKQLQSQIRDLRRSLESARLMF